MALKISLARTTFETGYPVHDGGIFAFLGDESPTLPGLHCDYDCEWSMRLSLKLDGAGAGAFFEKHTLLGEPEC
jgi:hypothetical protein